MQHSCNMAAAVQPAAVHAMHNPMCCASGRIGQCSFACASCDTFMTCRLHLKACTISLSTGT
jgi:hypothetical protein